MQPLLTTIPFNVRLPEGVAECRIIAQAAPTGGAVLRVVRTDRQPTASEHTATVDMAALIDADRMPRRPVAKAFYLLDLIGGLQVAPLTRKAGE